MSQCGEDRASNLKVLHVTSSRVCSILKYMTYGVKKKYGPSNVEKAARTGKYSKRMETSMEAFKFVDEDPTTVLRFLD